MSDSGSEAAAAALVGSLATFSLVDVLEFLSRTGHIGELQVVGREVDQRVWIDRGDIVTTGPVSPDTLLFDLACIEEGWFYFTIAEAAPEGGTRTPVGTALHDVGPQVEEWRSLADSLPFGATVKMSSSTPAAEVQIRADQWQLLSMAGSGGLTVREVLESSDKHPLDTLRTLRELTDNHLISVDGAAGPTEDHPSVAATESVAPEPPPQEPMLRALPDAPDDTGEVEASASAPPESSTNAPLPPFVPPPPIPPAPEGWVETSAPNGLEHPDAPEGAKPVGSADVATPSQTSVMPPPISGDPWSSARPVEQSGDESR